MAGEPIETVMGNRRRAAVNPDPLYADAVSVSRFWRLVETSGSDDCWLWQGDKDRAGYGVFCFRGKRYGAHELALSFTTGERRLKQLETCHSCDVPSCCNPAHLRFDTRQSNVDDMWARGRGAKPSLRLSPAEVQLMRERRAAGAPQKTLARDFKVSEAYVSSIVRGVKWPDAPGPIQKKNEFYRKVA